jgi:hypothetical protein
MAIQHELGHYIAARSREDFDGGKGIRGNGPRGPMDALAAELTTPRKEGYTGVPPGTPTSVLDQKLPRFGVDTLDHKSEYAVSGNPDEWWAEALLDGVHNGSRASADGHPRRPPLEPGAGVAEPRLPGLRSSSRSARSTGPAR